MIRFTLLLKAYLALYLLRVLAQVFLNELNLSRLLRHQGRVPEEFKGVVDEEKFKKISGYTLEAERFSLISTLIDEGIFLIFLLSGFLPWLVEMIQEWGWSLIVNGLAFFGIFSALSGLLRIPFSLYDTFVIEGRYEFNTTAFRTWILDLAKGLILTALIGGFLLCLLLVLVVYAGRVWWLWAWFFLGGFELLLLWLFPVVIAPLFNKFEPIENQELRERIRSLMEKVGLRVKGVFKMDASKRSKHTNAFFTGLGKNKRIVLFDTLLQSHPEDEILGVLAHEAGHWKKKHVLKEIALLELLSFVLFYVVSRLLSWPPLYETFGFGEPNPYIGLFLIGTLFSPLTYFLQPLGAAISRRFEAEADDFSLGLMKTPEPLCGALRRLAADNLENLTPHPLYAWVYYSHPPLIERIARLQRKQENRREK